MIARHPVDARLGEAIFSLFLVLTVLVLAGGPLAVGPAETSIPSQNDEFVGPFPSWSNLRTVYRAQGNGVADDTAAIQRALDELGTAGHSPVLFIPSGTYRVTKTLALAYTINVSIVGEDP